MVVSRRFSFLQNAARVLAWLLVVAFFWCAAAPRAAAQNVPQMPNASAPNNAASTRAAISIAVPQADASAANVNTNAPNIASPDFAPNASTRASAERDAISSAAPRSNVQAAPSIFLAPDAASRFPLARVLSRGDAPLFWAEGVARASELDAYAATGLTAVVVRLSWRASGAGAGGAQENGNAFEADFATPRAFAEAAARRGLRIIYAFPAAPSGGFAGLRIAGDNEAYAHLWESFVGVAMDALQTTPNLAGWMLPNDARALPYESEAGFTRWIFANYADVRVLNAQWLTNFGSLDDVTLTAAQQVAANWQRRKNAVTPQTRADAPDTVWPFHPAALAAAHYKLDAYRALVARWARIVKTLDNAHPLFSGALPDYAQMLALPPQVDVSMPAVFPGVGENDFLTHNPQAVDVARRGNRFRAVAMLQTAPASTRAGAQRDNIAALPPEALAALLPNWCREALLHGASGLAFSSWDGLSQNEEARRALTQTLGNLQSESWRDLWKTPPIATTAIVLTPLSDGYTRDAERPRGLYGFGENLVFGEPSNLVYALRLGTSFGSVDFLAPEDVESSDSTGNTATVSSQNDAPEYSLDENAPQKTFIVPPRIETSRRAPLSRYGALLLPQALSVSPAFADALGKYATSGGIVVADLGLGAMQNGGRVLGMPPLLAKLFGVASPRALAETSFNLRAGETNPLLPAWSGAVESALRGGFLTGGDGNGAAFSGAAALGGALPEGTTQLGFAPAPRDLNLGDLGVSLSLKPRGAGALIYAPFLLWRDWRPDHLGFAAFHGDLMVRRAAMLHLSAPAIVPAPGPLTGSAPLSPEVVNYENALILINHLPPLPPSQTPASTRTSPTSAAPTRATLSPAALSPIAFQNAQNASHLSMPLSDETRGQVHFSATNALASTRTAFAPSAFAPSAFAPSAFAPSAFAPSAFAPSAFAPSAFAPSAFAPSAPTAFDAISRGAATLGNNKTRVTRLLSSRNVVAPTFIAAKKKPATDAKMGNAPRVSNPARVLPSPLKGAAPTLQKPAAPAVSLASLGSQRAVIQTSGADGFLWNDALCAFDAASTRAPSTFAIARPLPVATVLAGEVAPRTVTLHARVLAAQSLMLKMLPLRAQNLDGGSLVARVTRFETSRAEVILWPNAQGIAPDARGDFAVTLGEEAALQITIFDSPSGYRVRPNSRHRITASEFGAPLLANGKRESATDTITADALGRLVINAGGTAPIIEIEPVS